MSSAAGTAKVGTVLKANRSGWSKSKVLTYRWLRDGNPIPNATSRTYKVRRADKGKTVSVRVTGTKAGNKLSKIGKKTYNVR